MNTNNIEVNTQSSIKITLDKKEENILIHTK